MTVVDHLLNFRASEADHANEVVTLQSLAAGLSLLASQVASLEAPIHSYESARGKRVSFFGIGYPEQFQLSEGDEILLPCYFHWFGVTLCNYARLVGLLGGESTGTLNRSSDKAAIKKVCGDYLKSIPELAPILVWRNKVYAHFARTDPYTDDNPALLEVSTMSPIAYSNGHFRVGGIAVTLAADEGSLPAWSIVEAWEALAPRFWPQTQK